MGAFRLQFLHFTLSEFLSPRAKVFKLLWLGKSAKLGNERQKNPFRCSLRTRNGNGEEESEAERRKYKQSEKLLIGGGAHDAEAPKASLRVVWDQHALKLLRCIRKEIESDILCFVLVLGRVPFALVSPPSHRHANFRLELFRSVLFFATSTEKLKIMIDGLLDKLIMGTRGVHV